VLQTQYQPRSVKWVGKVGTGLWPALYRVLHSANTGNPKCVENV